MSTEAAELPFGSRINAAGLRPVLLLVGIAAAVAAGVGVVLWSQGPSYSLLFNRLSNEDAAQVAQSLESAGIPYRVDTATGAVTVASDRLNDARLKLAGEGIPDSNGGFALMSKEPGFGVSQFMETARYQHALEQELARTIANLQPVEGARVHLALPRQSAFVRDRRSASASVFVQLKSGRRLESEQVTAIINLVASSIPELESSQVTVIDQQGRLLSSPEGNDEFSMRDKQLEFARKLEDTYTQRVEGLLASLVGPGRVRAQVVADVEMGITEETREQYRPESQIVRSEQLSEEMSRGAAGPQGVPGALTNQPPEGGTALPPGVPAPTDATVAPAQPAPDNLAKQTTRNYEIDRTLAYTKQPPGRLRRLSVAVVVDNQRATDAEGKVTETPLAPEQLENMTRLVKDAVGFDAARGDSVNVVNASFHPEAAIPEGEMETVPLWERPIFRDLVKLGAGALVLLVLALAVLRPLVRGLVSPQRPKLTSTGSASAASAAAGDDRPRAALSNKPEPAVAPLDYEQQVAGARTLVNQDPGRVAQVVKTWVSQDG